MLGSQGGSERGPYMGIVPDMVAKTKNESQKTLLKGGHINSRFDSHGTIRGTRLSLGGLPFLSKVPRCAFVLRLE